MSIADRLVLQRQHHLKWPVFDKLELVLMIICGVLCFGFSLSVTADIITRTLGAPLSVSTAKAAAASIPCSQLSSTSSIFRLMPRS